MRTTAGRKSHEVEIARAPGKKELILPMHDDVFPPGMIASPFAA